MDELLFNKLISNALIIILFHFLTSPSYASICGDSVLVDSENKVSKNGFLYYQGRVQVKAGLLTLNAVELSVRENATSRVFNLEKAKFSFRSTDKKEIRGSSKKIRFYAEECIIDLLDEVYVITDGETKKYKNARYFLDKNEIGPLWYYMDQGIKVAPKSKSE